MERHGIERILRFDSGFDPSPVLHGYRKRVFSAKRSRTRSWHQRKRVCANLELSGRRNSPPGSVLLPAHFSHSLQDERGELLDRLVAGEEIKQALRRVVADTRLESASASAASDALRGKRSFSYAKSAASMSPGLAAMAFPSSAPSNIARLAPSPDGTIRCAASPSSVTPGTRSHL